MVSAPLKSTRYLTFRVGSRRYALPATAVAEVVRIPCLARVPQGPPALLGVANLRGSVVAVVGLHELLHLGPGPDGAERLSLVLDQAAPTALVIDAVQSLDDVTADRIERAGEAWTDADGEQVVGAFKTPSSQELTGILNIDALLSNAFATRAAGASRERTTTPPSRRMDSLPERAASQLLLTFEVGGQEFAFPLADVQELLPLPASISAITRPDTVVLGFTSIRDSLIPLLSLRGLLGFAPASGATGREKILILTVAGAPAGLLVDDARAVVSAEIAAMEPVPAVIAARTGGESRIRAIYRGDSGRRLISILSPELLFRDEVMQRLVKGGQHVAVKTKSTLQAADNDAIFLVFRLGEDEFGLPIDSVVEVAPVPAQITRVPKAPKFLEGVVNLRGEVLPVVDQRRRFDMPPLDAENRRLVVVKTGPLQAGLIVDSVTDVLRTPVATIQPPPQLTAQISRLVHGVVNRDTRDGLVLLLDPAELLSRAEQGQLDSFQSQSRKARA